MRERKRSSQSDAHRRHHGTGFTPQTDERVLLPGSTTATTAGRTAPEYAGCPATEKGGSQPASQPTVPLACNKGAGKRRQ